MGFDVGRQVAVVVVFGFAVSAPPVEVGCAVAVVPVLAVGSESMDRADSVGAPVDVDVAVVAVAVAVCVGLVVCVVVVAVEVSLGWSAVRPRYVFAANAPPPITSKARMAATAMSGPLLLGFGAPSAAQGAAVPWLAMLWLCDVLAWLREVLVLP